MSDPKETFFTRVGCMDGRCQEVVRAYGRHRFGAEYPDTITDAGIVGILANKPSDEMLFDLKTKLRISSDKHKSKGVVVFGHTDCAGDPVDDTTQKEHIKQATNVVKRLIETELVDIPVCGVFIKKFESNPTEWVVEELC